MWRGVRGELSRPPAWAALPPLLSASALRQGPLLRFPTDIRITTVAGNCM